MTSEVFDDFTHPEYNYNWTSGAVTVSPAAPAEFQALLGAEIQRYIQWWEFNFAPSFASVGYKVSIISRADLTRLLMLAQAGVPEALTVPAAQWLVQNNYSALAVVFNEGMAVYGYGDIRQTPIVSGHEAEYEISQLTVITQLYMLQYFSPDVLRGLAHIDPIYLIGANIR